MSIFISLYFLIGTNLKRLIYPKKSRNTKSVLGELLKGINEYKAEQSPKALQMIDNSIDA